MRLLNKVLVIDVETTGFEPSKHACIEIGGVLLDESLHVEREFSSLIAPWEGSAIMQQAMEVNRITVEELRTAPLVDQVVKLFHQEFNLDNEKPLLAGWNVWFDMSFLRDLYGRAQRKWPFTHRLLDVQSIISFHLLMAGVSQEKAITKFLNDQQAHRALLDARHTGRLLQLFSQRYLSDLSDASIHLQYGN